MSNLIVVGFDTENKADEVLLELLRKEKTYKINMEDAAVVLRKNDGQLFIKHVNPLVTAIAARGSFWGLLIGILLLNPLAGVVAGGAIGAAVGSLEHVGIKDDFIKELGEKAILGGSILFIMEHEATTSSVFHELKKFDPKVIKTTFGYANEQKLREAFERKK